MQRVLVGAALAAACPAVPGIWGDNMAEQTQRAKQIKNISIRNIILNLILATLKVIAGLFAGSFAVVSDGLNSLSDVITTVFVLICNNVAKDSSDIEHQYGHEKIESLVTLLIAVFLGAVALITGYESIMGFVHKHAIKLDYFALGVTAFSAGMKYYMYRATKKIAVQTQSDSLGLVAMDFRFDICLSCSVFVGVLLAMLGLWFFEPLVAIAACLLLLKTTVEYFIRAAGQLIDRAADRDTVEQITKVVCACDGVRRIDLLRSRIHGSTVYVDIEISVDPNLTVCEGHAIAQDVHDTLEQQDTLRIKHCMVHVNPDLG